MFRAERQKRLERWFMFRCECEACAGDFPVMSGLSSALSQTKLDTIKNLLEKFQWTLKNKEVKVFKNVCLVKAILF